MTKHFKESEFKCKCGCNTIIHPPAKLLNVLESIREFYKEPVIITSGYRCPKHNANIGGALKSRHTFGDAVDIRVKNVPTKILHNHVMKCYYEDEELGVAFKENKNNKYQGFVHIDTWKKRTWKY